MTFNRHHISRSIACLLYLMAGMVPLAQPAGAATVKSARWENKGTYLRLTVELTEIVKNNIRNEIASRGYFYINLNNISEGFKKFPPPLGGMGVKRIRSEYFPTHDLQRFAFYVDKNVQYEVSTLVNPPRLVIDIARGGVPLANNTTRKKIVVIDPGHGGVSTGARSRTSVGGRHVWEKDVVMDVSLKLARLINQSPYMTARLTRTGDEYVSLTDRIDKSVRAEGDIFISLHCNSTPGTRPTKADGLEIYTWNEKAIPNAAMKYLESLENDAGVSTRINGHQSAELKNMLGTMMGDMLQQQKSSSELLAKSVYNSMMRMDYYKSRGRGVKNARFKVLENYEMPSILVEMGFMSNSREVKKLADSKFQDQIALQVYNGLNDYFQQRDKAFQPQTIVNAR